jgi:uncharacterized protein (TIGR01777 family)
MNPCMIGITGSTGLVGQALAAKLSSDGESFVAFSRNPERAPLPLRPHARAWPPASPLGLTGLVNLLGEPVSGRWNAEKKKAIRSSRIEGTKRLVEAIAKEPAESRPRVLVSASAIGFYGDRGAEELREGSSAGDDFLARVCVDWEREAMVAESLGVRVVTLRIGLVMSKEGGALEAMLPLFKLGLGGTMGSGKQYWPFIHLDDLVSMIRFALREPITGPLNATAPHPLSQAEFASTLAHVLKRPAFLPAPAFALRSVLGEFAFELLASRRVLPQKALDRGFTFKYPELEACLRDATRPH